MADPYADYLSPSIGGAGSDGLFSTLRDQTEIALSRTVALLPAYVATQLDLRQRDQLYSPLGQWNVAPTSQPKRLFHSGQSTIVPGIDDSIIVIGGIALLAFVVLR